MDSTTMMVTVGRARGESVTPMDSRMLMTTGSSGESVTPMDSRMLMTTGGSARGESAT